MSTPTESWLRTEAIFHDALACEEPERTAVLHAQCAGDPTLMAELRALLSACQAEEAHHGVSAAQAEVEVGRHVGAYAVERLLGRGGMGAVYLAHRDDGQFRQQVAVKIIDMPLATDAFRDRFRTERQILAGLAHPYIARLLDGGVTTAGELYLAMEYVDGAPITAFCERHTLSIVDRVKLFLKVVEAVQYAHGNLIVHRDLKPDNILVSSDRTPHLLDFGTAKILTVAAPQGDLTQAGIQAYTPRYASPEQVHGRPVGIASDIYSLGVLLYVLSTGRYPYQLTELSLDEMVRVICNEQPRRPSAGPLPYGRFGADLDSIVLKALRKEPELRYTTAQQLGEDLEAYLDQRPVKARRGNFRYLAGKFLVRNKPTAAGLVVILLLIIGGVAGIVRQSRRADRQRQRAEARSADLRELSNSLLSELNDALKEIPGSTGAQRLLVTRVLQHLDHMATDSQGDRQTELDLIGAYTRLGNVQGNIYYQNFADTKGAVASFDKALALATPLAQSYPRDRDVLRALASTLEAKGESLGDTGEAQASTEALQAAVATYDRVTALPGITPPLIFEAAIAYETLGSELGDDTGMADIPAATAAYQRALDMDIQALRMEPGYMAVRRGIPLMHVHLGALVLDTDPRHALEEFTLAQRLSDALPEDERRKLSQVRLHSTELRKGAQARAELGQYADARALFSEAARNFQQLVAADSQNISALRDLERTQDNWAQCEEYASDPLTANQPAGIEKALESARLHLQEEAATIRGVILKSQNADQSDLQLQGVQVRLSAVEFRLHEARNTIATTTLSSALASLAAAADKPRATANDLHSAASAFLQVRPMSLRRPDLAVHWAERAAALTYRRAPRFLLLLAEAYQASRQFKLAGQTAADGLAEIPEAAQGPQGTHLGKMLRSIAYGGRP